MFDPPLNDNRLSDYEKQKYDAQFNIYRMLRKNGRVEHHTPERRAVTPHDDALLSMWWALSGDIRNNPNERFKLDFTGVELTEELLQIIFGSLEDKKVLTALFRRANLTKEVLGSISKFAAARPELSTLYLDQNDTFGRHPALLEYRVCST